MFVGGERKTTKKQQGERLIDYYALNVKPPTNDIDAANGRIRNAERFTGSLNLMLSNRG
jgi:hypothetical protein